MAVPELIKKAVKRFHRYIKDRDSSNGYFTCISCGKTKSIEEMQAGHYFSAGKHPSLRFNEDNVNGQCEFCNCNLHGNLTSYRENLISKIGKIRFRALEEMVKKETVYGYKWDRFDLEEIIKKYK